MCFSRQKEAEGRLCEVTLPSAALEAESQQDQSNSLRYLMLPESRAERVFGSVSTNNQTGLLERLINKAPCLCLSALEKVFTGNIKHFCVFLNETKKSAGIDGGQDLVVGILLDC